MRNSKRAALAIGLGLVGVAGLVAPSHGQQPADGGVRQAASTNTASAQPVAKPAAPAVIGTIDIQQVAKNYDKVKVGLENIEAYAMARSKDLMSINSDATAEVEKLKHLAPGSTDQHKVENRIAELKGKMDSTKAQAQMDLARKEAEIYAMTYNEIHQMAQAVAKQRGMNLVIQASATAPSASDPNSIQMAMMRAVVVADPSLDLTRDVTYWLNAYYKQRGGPAPKGRSEAAAGANPAPAAAVSGAAAPTPR
jgi:Skp family chaperone for outer membrane proteins